MLLTLTSPDTAFNVYLGIVGLTLMMQQHLNVDCFGRNAINERKAAKDGEGQPLIEAQRRASLRQKVRLGCKMANHTALKFSVSGRPPLLDFRKPSLEILSSYHVFCGQNDLCPKQTPRIPCNDGVPPNELAANAGFPVQKVKGQINQVFTELQGLLCL